MPSHYNKMNQMSTNQRRTTNRVRRARNNTSAMGAMGVSSNMGNKPTFGNMIPVGQIKRMSGLPDDQIMFPYCLAQLLYADNPDPCCFDSNGNHYYQRRFEGPQTEMCMNGQQPNEAGGKLIKGMTNMVSLSELKGMVGGDDQIMMPYCGNDYNMENDPCCEEPAGQYWGTRRFQATTLCMNGQYPMEAGGSVKRTRAVGGSMGSSNPCPPGMHMMPDGSCMEGEYHGAPNGNGYRRGGRTKPKPVRKRAVGGSMGMGNNETMSPGSSCIGECRYSATGGSFDFISRPCPSNCECPPTEQNLPLVSGCRSAGGRGMVQRKGGRARRRFNTGGHAHIPQGGMGAPNHQHSIWNHVNEFHRNDAAYDSTNQTQHLSGHVNQAQQDNWYGQGEGSPANNQRRMNRMDRMKKGGRARRRFNTGGAPKMHYGGNTACRMITSKYDCVAPCTWDFNDGHCH